MPEDFLQTLRAIDPAVLKDVVRKDMRVRDNVPSADFTLLDWSVVPLRYEIVLETTGGLYCFSGRCRVGGQTMPWSVILKIVTHPSDGCEDTQELCYWRRELLAYQSGLLTRLPDAVRAPRCYRVEEREPGAWIWLENIQESAAPTVEQAVDQALQIGPTAGLCEPSGPVVWTLEHYQRAARRLGQFAGAYLSGTSLPDEPWLCGSIFRAMLADDDWWARFLNPASKNNAWQRPVVQTLFPEPRRSRVLRIWDEKWQFIEAIERLPRVFCHNDAHRRNLMLRTGPGGEEELVAIDWAFCGPGALGSDLGQLIGSSLSYFAVEPDQTLELETAVLDGYQSGLRDAGWTGDFRLARLGYTISLALYWGATLANEAAQAQPGQSHFNVEAKYGRPLDEILRGWVPLAELALDRADEARREIARMG